MFKLSENAERKSETQQKIPGSMGDLGSIDNGLLLSDISGPSLHTSKRGFAMLTFSIQDFFRQPFVRAVSLGQLLSLFIAGTGIFSTELRGLGFDFPTFQISFNYLLLSTFLLLRQKTNVRIAFWKYAILAAVDVEANFLVVTAYKYTSITSIMLLDCFTIPAVMVLSKVFLKAKYRKMHIVGALCSLAGLVLTVLSDAFRKDAAALDRYPFAVQGDFLCLAGAALYAFMNVLEEVIVKRSSQIEFLGMLGFWGTFISWIQIGVLERGFSNVVMQWGPKEFAFLGAFTACMVSIYSLTAIFLKIADSGMFNISLLTSDVYAVTFAVLFANQKMTWLYGISFFVTMVGVLIYSQQPLATAHVAEHGNEEVFDLLIEEDIPETDLWNPELDHDHEVSSKTDNSYA